MAVDVSIAAASLGANPAHIELLSSRNLIGTPPILLVKSGLYSGWKCGFILGWILPVFGLEVVSDGDMQIYGKPRHGQPRGLDVIHSHGLSARHASWMIHEPQVECICAEVEFGS